MSAQTPVLPFLAETVAGSDWVGDGGPARQALLFQAEGLAMDSARNLYVADAAGHRIRRITPSGVIDTFAGTGRAGFSGDGGPADEAALNTPYDLAFDASGNLFIADLGNGRVRIIDRDGVISTVAGGGTHPAGGMHDGAAALTIHLEAPRNLAFDVSGNLYISDFSGARVLRLNPAGALWAVAGTGVAGFSGDGTLARNAQLSHPTALAVNAQGVLFIADSQNHWIRKVENGLIHNIVTVGLPTGMDFDTSGTLHIADAGAGQILKLGLDTAGQYAVLSKLALAARDILFAPPATAGDPGAMYFSTGSRLMRLAGTNLVAFAGGGDTARGDFGPAVEARLNVPTGVAVSPDGTVYIADRENHRIRKVGPEGMIMTIAGTGTLGNSGDNGPSTRASLNRPEAVALDAAGNLYIADKGNQRVRRMTPLGQMEAVNLGVPQGTVAGDFIPSYVTPDSLGNLYVAGRTSIIRSDGNGAATVVAGQLASPGGMVLDTDGNLYFTETDGPRVMRLKLDGSLTEIASGAWMAPRAIQFGADGSLYVADVGRGQILQVPLNEDGTSGDPQVMELDAALTQPWDLAIGPLGEIYVAEAATNRVLRLTQKVLADPVLISTFLHAATNQPGPLVPGMLGIVTGVQMTAPEVRIAGLTAQVMGIRERSLVIRVPTEIQPNMAAEIEVFDQGVLLTRFTLPVVDALPALFTDDTGHALALNQDGSLNSVDNPAARGSIAALYGTGEGVSNLPVRVRIGHLEAEVFYAGPVEGSPGLWQINVRLPAGFVPPGSLTAEVFVGDIASPPAQLEVR